MTAPTTTGVRWRVLLALFLVLPIVEVVLVVAVARAVGVAPTLLSILALSTAGALVVRQQGRRALADLRAGRSGHPRTITDRVVTAAGGLLLLLPGFVSSLLALPFFLPFARPLLRQAGARWAVRRGSMVLESAVFNAPGPLRPSGPHSRTGPPREPGHRVVRGEVIDGS